MTLGVVKSFDSRKGSGLITPDGGGPDIFVHISAVERAGLPGLTVGERVSYDTQTDRALARSIVTNLQIL